MPLSSPTKILLTGGTSGIGAVMRDMLLAEGHDVIVVARTASRLQPEARLHLYDCDLSDSGAVIESIGAISVAHPEIGILINNAALQYDTPLIDPAFDAEQMMDEVSINLVAPALITQYLVKTVRLHAIVNISSGLAFFPKQQSALYCATKAAIHSFSTTLRYQLEASATQVSEAILPIVDTPMTAGRGSGKMPAEAAARAILDGVRQRKAEIYVGKARLIPIFARLAPSIGRKILRGT
jgi:uncharacterized oxidoreductase